MEVGGYQRPPPLPNCWHSSLIRDEAPDGNNPGQSVRKVEGRNNSKGEVEGVGVQFPERKSFFQPNGKFGGRQKKLADAKKIGRHQKIWRTRKKLADAKKIWRTPKNLADAKKFGGCQKHLADAKTFGGRQKIWRNILAGQMHGTLVVTTM